MNARLVRMARGSRQPLHRHGEARAIVFLRGAVTEDTFGDAVIYAPGDVLVRPAFFPHANEADALGAAYVQLRLAPEAARRLAGGMGWRPLRGTCAIWRDAPGDLVRPETLLAALSSAALSSAAPQSAQCEDPIGAAVARSHHPLAAIAAMNGQRPFAFTRAFARRHGMAPRAFRLRARLHCAMELIARDAGGLALIAAESGFHDQSHLTTAMRRETGLTPGAFRRLVSH